MAKYILLCLTEKMKAAMCGKSQKPNGSSYAIPLNRFINNIFDLAFSFLVSIAYFSIFHFSVRLQNTHLLDKYAWHFAISHFTYHAVEHYFPLCFPTVFIPLTVHFKMETQQRKKRSRRNQKKKNKMEE